MKLYVLRHWKEELSKWVGKCFYGLVFIFGLWWGFLPFEFFYLVVLPIVLAISVFPWLVVTVMIYWKERGTEKLLRALLGKLIYGLIYFFRCLLIFPIMCLVSAFVFIAVVHCRDVIGLGGDFNRRFYWVMIAAAFVTGMKHQEFRSEMNPPKEVRELKKRIKELEGKIDDSD